MELNHHALLIISISSLIFLSFSAEATDLSPSPAPVSYISSSPASSPSPLSGSSEVAFVLESTVKRGCDEAELTVEFISKQIQDPSTSPIEAECFKQCAENYNGIVDDFKKAQEGVSSVDFYSVSENLSAVYGDIDACQQCFQEMLGTDDSPIAKFDTAVKKAAEHTLSVLQYTS
uniref:Putative Pectinesterase inhibitor n=1 Tax=Davidia involucrata TaxID=16924 RepID=A0A5B7BWS3_DAVIN